MHNNRFNVLLCFHSSWPMWSWRFDWRHHFCRKLPGLHPAAVGEDAHEERPHAAGPGGHEPRPGEQHSCTDWGHTAGVSSGVLIIRCPCLLSFYSVLKHVHTNTSLSQWHHDSSEVMGEKHVTNISGYLASMC